MANYSYLMGCRSGEHAVAQAEALFGDGDGLEWDCGPQLGGRYAIPLFWLAAFDGEDRLWFERSPDEDEDGEVQVIPIYWSPAETAIARLKARTPVMVAIIGEKFAGFYAEWIAYVERCYPAALMLHAEDLLDIDGVAVSGPRLHAAIEGLQAGVVDKRLRDILYRNGTLPFEPRGGKLSPQQVADHCRAMLAGSNMDFGGGNEEDWPPPAPGSETAASAAARLARPWWRFW